VSKSDMTTATNNASKASGSSATTDVAIEVYNVVEARHGRVMSGQIVVPA
jgi:hypothetical protein